MPESFDIADAPRQSTQRVARSAAGFEASVYIAAEEDGHCVPVVVTELVFERVQIETETRIGLIRVGGGRPRTSVVDCGKSSDERDYNQPGNFSAQS
jgi:hypothetical protein